MRLKNIAAFPKQNNIFRNFLNKKFSEFVDIPTIDFQKFLNKSEGWKSECQKVADCLHDTGILIIKDPRADEKDNEVYVKMMEKYFHKVSKGFYNGEKLEDAYPEHHYQHGVTPEHIERAREHCSRMKSLLKEDAPVTECPPLADSKWRFFWNIGERNPEPGAEFDLYPNISPKGFPEWEHTMNNWGNKLLGATETTAQMAAIGFKLEENTFTQKMKYANHLLAPTGSDLNKFDVGTVFAGYHYDLNFLTIHGKSNYGGLFVWLRNGQKRRVKVPDGCLLIQAGIQLEYLTGGDCMAGFHEVVYTQELKDVVEKKRKENESISDPDKKHLLWRVSSTLFSHIRSNVILEPLEHYKNAESLKKYPSILTHEQVKEELKAINLF